MHLIIIVQLFVNILHENIQTKTFCKYYHQQTIIITTRKSETPCTYDHLNLSQ